MCDGWLDGNVAPAHSNAAQMRQTTIAKVRLEDGKAARSGIIRRTMRGFGRGQRGCDRISVRRASPRRKIAPTRPRLGECRLNWSRGRGMLPLASVGSEIPMSELHDGIALDDDAES
jgi:hypothetical protein